MRPSASHSQMKCEEVSCSQLHSLQFGLGLSKLLCLLRKQWPVIHLTPLPKASLGCLIRCWLLYWLISGKNMVEGVMYRIFLVDSKSCSSSLNPVTYFHQKILALAGIWTRDIPCTKPICYQLSYPGHSVYEYLIYLLFRSCLISFGFSIPESVLLTSLISK